MAQSSPQGIQVWLRRDPPRRRSVGTSRHTRAPADARVRARLPSTSVAPPNGARLKEISQRVRAACNTSQEWRAGVAWRASDLFPAARLRITTDRAEFSFLQIPASPPDPSQRASPEPVTKSTADRLQRPRKGPFTRRSACRLHCDLWPDEDSGCPPVSTGPPAGQERSTAQPARARNKKSR